MTDAARIVVPAGVEDPRPPKIAPQSAGCDACGAAKDRLAPVLSGALICMACGAEKGNRCG